MFKINRNKNFHLHVRYCPPCYTLGNALHNLFKRQEASTENRTSIESRIPWNYLSSDEKSELLQNYRKELDRRTKISDYWKTKAMIVCDSEAEYRWYYEYVTNSNFPNSFCLLSNRNVHKMSSWKGLLLKSFFVFKMFFQSYFQMTS